MLLVLLYWIFLLVVLTPFGVLLTRILGLKNVNPEIQLLFGVYMISAIASLYALFDGLGYRFDLLLIGLALLGYILFNKETFALILSLKAKFTKLPSLLKYTLVILMALALAQSASSPYLIDNESYYIQTIKWLDSYGFVPGLANLHAFLGQTSAWHISQSALNLNTLFPHFNDLNGFFLVLANCYAFGYLNTYFKTKKWTHLTVGLFPIFNIFLFQFISSPSPDIPLYICFLIILAEFLTYQKDNAVAAFKIITTLAIFSCFVKPTAALYLLVAITIVYIDRSVLKKSWLPLACVGLTTLVLFVLKNSIVTGYPIYPLSFFQLGEWALPESLQNFYVQQTKLYGFFMTPEVYEQATPMQRFIRWLRLPKLHGFFNISMCILLLIFPLIIYRSKTLKKRLVWLYVISVLQLTVLLLSSPQYRFFFMFFMALSLIGYAIVLKGRFTKTAIIISTLIIAIPLFAPLNLNWFTKNEFHLDLKRFSFSNLIIPHQQTRYTDAIFRLNEDSKLYTPENIDFFWATGDCPIPCVQQQQLDYFKTYFKLEPVLRTAHLKDGFISKEVTID